jgi:hypothetical protein
MNAVKQKQQTISFCGVNAHFQNGIAEKRIRDLQEHARTMMLHAKSRWPKGVSIHLWPYALSSANQLRQVTPDKEDGTSPLERFSGAEVAANLEDCHTPLCPVYALNSSLASGKSIPKWDNMCRLGINLGPSPRHARNVSLVLNLTTGLSSPQFHVKHDELFETVAFRTGAPDTISNWQSLAGFWMIKGKKVAEDVSLTPVRDEQKIVHQEFEQEHTQVEETSAEAVPESSAPHQALEVEALEGAVPALPPMVVGTRRSSRDRRPTARMLESVQQEGLAFAAERNDIQEEEAEERYYDAMHEDEYRIQDDMMDPIAFLTKADEDTMYFHQAMKVPEKEELVKAIVKEMNDHIVAKNWELVPRQDVPEGVKVLDSVWAMKRKRDILTRKVLKYKARLNVHGGKQEFAVNYFETYSPVVTWAAVRLMTTLAWLNNWHTRQCDFALAYPQAPIEFDLYMELPKGIQLSSGNNKTHVLRLIKNLYGQKQAGRVWNQHLAKGLKKAGFVTSKVD